MISVICPYTDEMTRKRMLDASLEKQTYRNYEYFPINNCELGLRSASETLNYGADQAKGDILVFCHQDIELLENDILKKIEKYCEAYDFGIGAVAGIGIDEPEVFSSVVQGTERQQAGRKILQPIQAETVDECFFFIKRDSFMGFTNLGNVWHFYAVEYSLKCKQEKKDRMLFPLPVYHLSPGWSLDNSYWKTLLRIKRMYRDYPVIPTTMGIFKYNIKQDLYVYKQMTKNLIKKQIMRK